MARYAWFDKRNQSEWAREKRRRAREEWERRRGIRVDPPTRSNLHSQERREAVQRQARRLVRRVQRRDQREVEEKIEREIEEEMLGQRRAFPGEYDEDGLDDMMPAAVRAPVIEAFDPVALYNAPRKSLSAKAVFRRYLRNNPIEAGEYAAATNAEKAAIARRFYKKYQIGSQSPTAIANRKALAKARAAKDMLAGTGIFSAEAKAKRASAPGPWFWNYSAVKTNTAARKAADNVRYKAYLKKAMLAAAVQFMADNPGANIVHGYY